ncbi:MAG: hypothetical protein KA463_04975 [Flavobacterium sp.]|nr:hypothetical protein [Flavobacterium sp.]MBP7182498.1 hypothetical protein [Flavobacterium sp.]MBP7317339.1 hypothetical protein [Flavobacterium sp.]MBP8885956.1 hypothetical protein [Flavobacterium sp.]
MKRRCVLKGKNIDFIISNKSFVLCQTQTRELDVPENPSANNQNINQDYRLSFEFSSIFLDILKMRRINTAQKEAIIPIKATTLSP